MEKCNLQRMLEIKKGEIMKSGTYKVTFHVDLVGCNNEEEAHSAVSQMVNEALDDDRFPELEFELVEELDEEYNTEEEVEELDFEEAV